MADDDRMLAALATDARWLPHRYDPGHDTVHMVWADRARHRAATFLTDAGLGLDKPPAVVARAELMARAGPTRAPALLLHSAFCCSTLLARVLDREDWAMALKEPVILNDLAGWRSRGTPADALARVTADALHLLGRPFGPGEGVAVKPSNIANLLAEPILERHPAVRAVVLHAPLRTFLTSVARKGLEGRLWVRELYLGLLKGGIGDLGFDADAIFGQTDLQVAAAGWLVQHRLFHRLLARFGPARVRSLDSERMLAEPAPAVAGVAELFGLAHDPALIAQVVGGDAFGRHSKTGEAFDADARARERAAGESLYADEISKVAIWAEQVAAHNGIPLALPAPLV